MFDSAIAKLHYNRAYIRIHVIVYVKLIFQTNEMLLALLPIMARSNDPTAQYAARLTEISEALGLEVGRFYDATAPAYISDLLDLIRAYAAISEETARQRVRECARSEALISQSASMSNNLG